MKSHSPMVSAAWKKYPFTDGLSRLDLVDHGKPSAANAGTRRQRSADRTAEAYGDTHRSTVEHRGGRSAAVEGIERNRRAWSGVYPSPAARARRRRRGVMASLSRLPAHRTRKGHGRASDRHPNRRRRRSFLASARRRQESFFPQRGEDRGIPRQREAGHPRG